MFAAARAWLTPTLAVAADAGLMAQQTRNTFILKRRKYMPLHKKGGKVPKLRNRHFIYDLVQDTDIARKPDLKVILKQFVAGVGHKGQIISMRPIRAYRDLLVPGLAVYASPYNLQKYEGQEEVQHDEEQQSSPYVQRTINCLSRLVLQITMSKSEPWELEPWHVRTSFRKACFVVPEHAIQMPPHKITGPDLTLQNKEFYVTVTINGQEKVNVRCRIHHWATGLERLQWAQDHWKMPCEPLFPEQAEVLKNMPLPQ